LVIPQSIVAISPRTDLVELREIFDANSEVIHKISPTTDEKTAAERKTRKIHELRPVQRSAPSSRSSLWKFLMCLVRRYWFLRIPQGSGCFSCRRQAAMALGKLGPNLKLNQIEQGV
jgi:hypothetical protein